MTKQQINKIESLLDDALSSLGTGDCKVNECEGCKVDKEFTKDNIKSALKVIYELQKEGK